MSASRAISDQGKATRSQWFIGLVAFLFVCSLWAFHNRWDRPFTSSPIDLPEIPYAFTQHLDLLPFDQATQEKWNAMIHQNWWDMKWTDTSSGEVVTRGVDMLHKLHCLIALREEFTTLANDPNRYLKFQAEDHSSLDMRLYLGHCFDFLRQDILCAADDTLEPLGVGYTETDGIGVVHQCRDWHVITRHAKMAGNIGEGL